MLRLKTYVLHMSRCLGICLVSLLFSIQSYSCVLMRCSSIQRQPFLHFTNGDHKLISRQLLQFSEWNNGPRNPTFFNDGFAEAIRLIEVDLEVLDLDSSPSKFDDPEHPPIVFKGTSHGMHGSIARIEGSVRMFANGVIRWNFVSLIRIGID